MSKCMTDSTKLQCFWRHDCFVRRVHIDVAPSTLSLSRNASENRECFYLRCEGENWSLGAHPGVANVKLKRPSIKVVKSPSTLVVLNAKVVIKNSASFLELQRNDICGTT